MYKFGKKSKERLEECDPKIQEVFNELINYMDISIICGYRGKEEQNKAFNEGRSKLKYPESKHNKKPSLAVDAVPYPLDWDDRERFSYMAGMARMIAKSKGYDLRWGGDWDSDGTLKDNNFDDLPHFELKI